MPRVFFYWVFINYIPIKFHFRFFFSRRFGRDTLKTFVVTVRHFIREGCAPYPKNKNNYKEELKRLRQVDSRKKHFSFGFNYLERVERFLDLIKEEGLSVKGEEGWRIWSYEF